MSFRVAVLALVLCAVGYGQSNRIGRADYPYRYGRMTPAPIYTPDCSATSQMPPNPADASLEDFVELERSLCFGGCPAYRVRVHRTGKVEWLPGYPGLMQGAFDTISDPVEAAELFDRAYALEFWSACESYPVAEDAPTYYVRLSISGKRAAIEFGYDTGFNWLDAFTADLDRIVDTHRRFHGDPATEALIHISQEVSLSKRSMTTLMRAAARGEIESVALLLAGGASVDEQDASGWTALMYAGGSHQANVVSLLLESGADPNHTDIAGRTPLMASARGSAFEGILAASRSVDHRSQAGVTVLMLLAGSANVQGVRLALANGADPALMDANGRNAWNHLRQSHCGGILFVEKGAPALDFSVEEQECFELDRLLKLPVR